MREQNRKEFPKWCGDNEKDYDLILSDDLDSLLSCIILGKIKGYEINQFYDFNNLYQLKETGNETIGIDLDLVKGKGWGNHVTKISPHDSYNREMANLNLTENINRMNYTNKYNSNTLLTIMSYYSIPISKLSEEGKAILLCIDSAYYPFYNNSFKFTGEKWLVDILGYDALYELTQRYDKSDFDELQKKYNLKGKIWINDIGELETDIDLTGVMKALNGLELDLLKGKFTKIRSFETISSDLKDDYKFRLSKREIEKRDIFSFAVTFRHYIKYSI